MAEAGVEGIKVTTWYGVWAVKGTPRPIIDKMYQAIAQVLKDPDIKKVWDSQGADLGGMPPAEFNRFVRSEIENWGTVVKASGAKIDN